MLALHSFAHNRSKFFVCFVFGFLGEPFFKAFKSLVNEHAFAGYSLAAFGFGHLQKLGMRRRIDDIADNLALVEAIVCNGRFVNVWTHAHRCRVDDDVEICGNAREFIERRDLDGLEIFFVNNLCLEKFVQRTCKSFAFFLGAAYDGQFVFLFHKRKGNRLGGAAVSEESDFFMGGRYTVFFEITYATIRVSCGPAKRSADNAVFPVQRVHAFCELADIAQFIDELGISVCVDEFRLVGDGDVCAVELHRLETFNGLGEIFWFWCVGEIRRIDAEGVKKGVVHSGRFAVCNRMPENAKSFRLSVYGSQSNLVLSFPPVGKNSK